MGRKQMTRADDEIEAGQAFKTLSDAGLIEIQFDEFVEKIRDVKRLVTLRLRELLDLDAGAKERDSAAHSLGTLKSLELKVLKTAPNSDEPSEP